jgi:hypothetical protein
MTTALLLVELAAPYGKVTTTNACIESIAARLEGTTRLET